MPEENNGNSKRSESNPEFDNFQRLLKQVLSVPKQKLDEKRAEHEREKEERQAG